jgi:hypothetical protein
MSGTQGGPVVVQVRFAPRRTKKECCWQKIVGEEPLPVIGSQNRGTCDSRSSSAVENNWSLCMHDHEALSDLNLRTDRPPKDSGASLP